MKKIVTTDYKMEYTTVSVSEEKVSGTEGFKCDGKPCYVGTLSITIPSACCTQGSKANAAPITFTISPTSQNVKVDGVGVVLDGDNTTVGGVLLVNPSNDKDTATVSFNAKICANQTRVKAS